MKTSELLVAYQNGRWMVSVRHEDEGFFEFFHSREVAVHRALRWVQEHPLRKARVTEPDGSSWTLI